jgi:arginase
MVLRTLMGDGRPRSCHWSAGRSPTQIVLAGVQPRPGRGDVHQRHGDRGSRQDLLVPDRVTGRLRSGGVTKIHIHLDLDVLDPIEFPDVLVPAPGGVSTTVSLKRSPPRVRLRRRRIQRRRAAARVARCGRACGGCSMGLGFASARLSD